MHVDVVAAYHASALVVAGRHVDLPSGVAIALRCGEHVGTFVVVGRHDDIDEAARYYSIRPLGEVVDRSVWSVGARWLVDTTAISLRGDDAPVGYAPAFDDDDAGARVRVP
jgi:hypothetical protein